MIIILKKLLNAFPAVSRLSISFRSLLIHNPYY